jgi:hypothetical protein
MNLNKTSIVSAAAAMLVFGGVCFATADDLRAAIDWAMILSLTLVSRHVSADAAHRGGNVRVPRQARTSAGTCARFR